MRNIPTTIQWVPVDLGEVEVRGVEWGHEYALAYGYRRPASDMVPFAARVSDEGDVVVFDLPAHGRIASLYHAGMGHVVCLGESPATLYHLPGHSSTPELLEVDEPFLAGTRTWMAGADGHDFYVTQWEDDRLTTGEAWHEDYLEGPGLRGNGDPEELLVGSSDVVTLVAGLLSSGDEPPAVGLWTNAPDEGPRWPGGWTRVELDPAPDGFTQIRSSVAPSVAGHRDGRPLLFTHESAVEVRLLDVPDVPLDPAHPQVLDTAYGIAVQSLYEGPQLWTKTDLGWRPHPLPSGRLDAASVCTTSDLVWLVVDGRLWRPLE